MARIKYWQFIVDEEGRPIENASIKFYLTNTVVPAEIFLHPTAGTTTTTTITAITTDSNGFFEFYIGDEWESSGGYSSEQKFKIVWSKAGIATSTINNIDVFPAIFQVDETDNTSLEKDVKNKLISNALAYKWTEHVEGTFGTEPHGIQAVNQYDIDTDYNKLVSNSMMNYMFSVLSTAGTISIEATGAVVRNFNVTSWTSSASEYYIQINHYIGRDYPVVQVRDIADDQLIVPSLVETIDENSIRLWVSEDIDVDVTVIG
jgi:hypothetical protein